MTDTDQVTLYRNENIFHYQLNCSQITGPGSVSAEEIVTYDDLGRLAEEVFCVRCRMMQPNYKLEWIRVTAVAATRIRELVAALDDDYPDDYENLARGMRHLKDLSQLELPGTLDEHIRNVLSEARAAFPNPNWPDNDLVYLWIWPRWLALPWGARTGSALYAHLAGAVWDQEDRGTLVTVPQNLVTTSRIDQGETVVGPVLTTDTDLVREVAQVLAQDEVNTRYLDHRKAEKRLREHLVVARQILEDENEKQS